MIDIERKITYRTPLTIREEFANLMMKRLLVKGECHPVSHVSESKTVSH